MGSSNGLGSSLFPGRSLCGGHRTMLASKTPLRHHQGSTRRRAAALTPAERQRIAYSSLFQSTRTPLLGQLHRCLPNKLELQAETSQAGLHSALWLQHIRRYIVQFKTILFLLMADHRETSRAAGGPMGCVPRVSGRAGVRLYNTAHMVYILLRSHGAQPCRL